MRSRCMLDAILLDLAAPCPELALALLEWRRPAAGQDRVSGSVD